MKIKHSFHIGKNLTREILKDLLLWNIFNNRLKSVQIKIFTHQSIEKFKGFFG